MRAVKTSLCACLVLAASLLAGRVHADLVAADFNGLDVGGLTGQGGGMGLSGTWAGSSGFLVQSGDLTYANYYVTQFGTPASVRSTAAGANQYRSLSTPMTGEIWFTYLFKNSAGSSRSGIRLNVTSDTSGDPYIIMVGSSNWAIDLGAGQAANSVSAPLNQTHLALGRMLIQSGADELDLWLDPDLIDAGVSDLGAPKYSNYTVDFASALSTITLTSYADTGGTLDALRIASGPGAFGYAIGLPEPSTWAMILGLAGMAALRFARRRKRTG